MPPYNFLNIQNVPLATESGIFLNNFTTNEDIVTKFEANYGHNPRLECVYLSNTTIWWYRYV